MSYRENTILIPFSNRYSDTTLITNGIVHTTMVEAHGWYTVGHRLPNGCRISFTHTGNHM